ncbi:hypothetical protein GOV11_02695 [Candidatus Woesearchaeota archaeon]|nr:hypothetical protein [Candidatus Woesearchaeota archaeon]
MAEPELHKRLDRLQADVETLKKRSVDVDLVLTEDDLEALDEADKEFEQGKTTAL